MTPAGSLFATFVSRWPFANGSGRIIDTFGKGVDLGAGLREVATTDGFRMSVLPDDLIGRHIILSGQFDRSVIAVLIDFAEPGDQCLDIGANIGYTACLMLAGITGSKVLAVEPQPRVHDLLAVNLSQFPQDRWRTVNAALSDTAGQGFMQPSEGNLGAGRLVDDPGTDALSVALLPAAEVIGSLPRLDLVKMDVEGFEETIFRAGAEVFERMQPRAILFEDALGKAPPDGAIGALLSEMGYALYAIDKSLLSTRLVPLGPGDKPRANDYIALSRRRALPERAVRRYKITLPA